jgi:hypothetical protein
MRQLMPKRLKQKPRPYRMKPHITFGQHGVLGPRMWRFVVSLNVALNRAAEDFCYQRNRRQ